MINKLENKIDYDIVFSPERNEFFKQGGFRSSNYKRAKAHYNKVMKSLEQSLLEDNKAGVETGLQTLNELSETVETIYKEAKLFKETGNKPVDTELQLLEEVANCKFKVQEAKKNGESLTFLASTLHDPTFLLKVSLSRCDSLVSTVRSLEEMYENSLSADKSRLQQDIQTFVKSVMSA